MPSIKLSLIVFRDDARAIDAGNVEKLAESMGEIGLVNPVYVRPRGDGYEVCAGHHRVEAARKLGWDDIAAIIGGSDDLEAELVMIDENLCRAELSPVDRAHYTERRKVIYLERHPETGHGGERDQASRQLGDLPSDTENVLRFTKETAKKTGRSERAVQRDAERGEKIAADVLRKIKGTHLDNGVYLDALKKLGHDEQRKKIEHDLNTERKRRERQKRKPILAPEPIADEDVEEQQFAALMTAWNKASAPVRQRFREEIDTPVMDSGDIPNFLRRA